MVSIDRALLCLRHRVEAGQSVEDACYAVAIACKTSYDDLIEAYQQGGQGTLHKTRLVAGYGWPVCPTQIH